MALAVVWVVGGLWPTTDRCDVFLVLDDSFGDERCPFGGFPPPCYLVILFGLTLYMHTFEETSNLLDFHSTPQMTLSFSDLSPYLPAHHPFLPSFDPYALVPTSRGGRKNVRARKDRRTRPSKHDTIGVSQRLAAWTVPSQVLELRESVDTPRGLSGEMKHS